MAAVPCWRLPADDPFDPPTMITLSAQMGLRSLELTLTDADGMCSPARARHLAMLLLDAADEAESCVLIDAEEVS